MKAFKKKNTLTSGSTNFRTSTLVRHIESRDHWESVIACQSAQRMEMMIIFFQRRSISDSGTAHSLLHGQTRYRIRQVSGLHRLPSDARVFIIECNHNWQSSQCVVPQSRHCIRNDGTACEISVIYVFSITIRFKCFFRNCPSNFSNVPLNVDEWDRMSHLYPDLVRITFSLRLVYICLIQINK